MSEPTPLFLFSLPRSGSTLLQRLLASHPTVSTVSEPWLLLPLVDTLRDEDVFTDYRHRSYRTAFRDWVTDLPEGEETFRRDLAGFAHRIYDRLSDPDSRYFLDKTPRYHVIADRILELFPDARAVFLWRNPLAVVSSMTETWADGAWNVHLYRVDLYRGLDRLVRTRDRFRDRTCAVRYEDLVTRPEDTVRTLCGYLDLSFETEMIDEFDQVDVTGAMGDPTGDEKYSTVSTESLRGWEHSFSNPLRRWWARRYLRWIGRDRLEAMGYDRENMEERLEDVPTDLRRLGGDLLHFPRAWLHPWLEPTLLRSKWALRDRPEEVVAHH